MSPVVKTGPALVAVLLLLPVSCSEDTRPADALVPLEKMATELRSALCARVYDCCSPEQRKGNARIGQDVASCREVLDHRATFLLADVHLSVEGGRVAYHAAEMTSCLARIRTAGCEELRMPAANASITQICERALEP